MDVMDDLRLVMKQYIESDIRISSHLATFDHQSPELTRRLVEHILGSVHLFPPSRHDSFFYEKLYYEIHRITIQALHGAKGGAGALPGKHDRIPGQ